MITDAPHTLEYNVEIIAPEDVGRITLYLGFRDEQRVDYYVRYIIQELVKSKEIDIKNKYETLMQKNIAGDFHFIILERYLSSENELSNFEIFVLNAYYFVKQFTTTKDKWYGIDVSPVTIERVPLLINPITHLMPKRI